jgi:hypothetical protein
MPLSKRHYIMAKLFFLKRLAMWRKLPQRRACAARNVEPLPGA